MPTIRIRQSMNNLAEVQQSQDTVQEGDWNPAQGVKPCRGGLGRRPVEDDCAMRRLGPRPCTGTPPTEQTYRQDCKHCLPATSLVDSNNVLTFITYFMLLMRNSTTG